MFNVEFLHVIREFEYRKIIGYLEPGARVLEIGGGTGYQAKRLTQDGFDVASIDVADSVYADKQEFPVQAYDGRVFPFPDASFDIVFSSNVLEHVKDLEQLHSEERRVLKPGGYCLHVMPTGAWRFWTNVAHYVELCQRLLLAMPRLIPRGFSRTALLDALRVAREMAGLLKYYLVVPRHGEVGNALTEVVTFSRRHWLRHFARHNFAIQQVAPTGLFYTGHMVFGKGFSIPLRQKLSEWLGSACVIYRVQPK